MTTVSKPPYSPIHFQLSPAGLEQNADSSGNVANSSKSLAESYAKSKESSPTIQDLESILSAWQQLPESVRSAIMTMVRHEASKDEAVKKKES